MSKKTLLTLGLIIGLAVIGLLIFNPGKPKSPISPLNLQTPPKEAVPSETMIEYTDPAGFTISYPDNLSIIKNDIADETTYADIQLTSLEVSGSLNLKISDSKYTTLPDWIKLNKAAATEPPKDVKLGSLQGKEIKTIDRLLLGALDHGVFFNIEMPLIETNFWMKVYGKVLAGFSFVSPQAATGDTSSSDVSFEGEEVVQ